MDPTQITVAQNATLNDTAAGASVLAGLDLGNVHTVVGFLDIIRDYVRVFKDPLTSSAFNLTSAFINEVIAKIMPGGRATAYPENSDDDCKRITISIKVSNADYSTEAAKYCHGMILEYPSMDVLCLPSAGMDLTGSSIRPIEEYDVFVIDDGTVINLYYWEYTNQWYISSATGYEMNNVKWVGDLTYEEVFAEIMGKSFNAYCELLDPNMCYTFGIRHHSWHHLLTDPQRAWFIQCADISELNIIADEHQFPTLQFMPRDKFVTTDGSRPDGSNVNPLPPVQTKVTHTLAEINNNNTRGLSNYRNSLRKSANPSNNRPHYGYILRSKTGYPDVRLESDFGALIRKIMYNFDYHAKTDRKSVV